MNFPAEKKPFIAIACGGTGGHLFPGVAIASELKNLGCEVALLVSPKEVDQQAVKHLENIEVFTLPAAGLQNWNYLSFARSFWNSFRAARKIFAQKKPAAVLAMGGFTSAPPVLAARKFGAKTFLHESNTVPGKANRFLSRFVDEAFIGFPEAASPLKAKKFSVTGTPVRPQFSAAKNDAMRCRAALGLDPNLPTVLIVGGSQGARGLNDLVLSTLPLLKEKNWQWLHLTGAPDFEKVKNFYAAQNFKVVVKPFLAEMDLALGAATACVSRAGASSLAETAAMRLPSALVPLPTAAENHQYFNARAFEKTGAANLLGQYSAPEKVAAVLTELVENNDLRSKLQSALAQWHSPDAAFEIAGRILESITKGRSSKNQHPSSKEISNINHQAVQRTTNFGIWTLMFLWSLDVGSWSF
jgi:UDP-N-acetylglucosamine--N-acetylmuramyl-(pentapeptide) pyrophosphoryl-undecaprenol N-acetylglucosamine transferase